MSLLSSSFTRWSGSTHQRYCCILYVSQSETCNVTFVGFVQCLVKYILKVSWSVGRRYNRPLVGKTGEFDSFQGNVGNFHKSQEKSYRVAVYFIFTFGATPGFSSILGACLLYDVGDHNLSLFAAKSLGNRCSCRHKIASASVVNETIVALQCQCK